MTDVYHGEDIAFDLYPKTDPKNGPRIRRLTSLQRGSFTRREQKGTGVVTIVIPGDSDDAEAIDPALGHYIKAERKGAIVNLVTSAAADDVVDTAAAHGLVVGEKLEFVTLTGGTGLSTTPAYYVQSVPSSTSLKVAATKGGAAINFTTDITAGSIRKLKTVAGGFLLGGNYNALSADGTKPLVLTGPGPLHYLARARMAPHSYLGDDPQPEGVWPLHNQGAWFGDDHYGSEFARALTEMKATQADDPGDDPDSPHPNDNDRLDDPLPALTFDFDGFTDSNGAAWTGARGEFDVQVALEDGLRIAFRFMQAGVEIDIDPDQFELHAYNAGTLGTDRTGLAWGAGVVRFQVPTNDQVDTSNVFTTAKRALAAFIQRSLIWAGRGDVWGVARNASAPVRWEGGHSADSTSETALNTIAGQQITERTDAGDVPRLKVWAGNDESKGQYTYGPGGHADIWDRGTVHSGTGTWDWNQWTAPLSALEWRIENPNGEFDTWVEFGSTFRSIDEVMRFAGGAVGAHTHPPNPRLCPPTTEFIETGSDWKLLDITGGSEPAGWKDAGFDDSAWETPLEGVQASGLQMVQPTDAGDFIPNAVALARKAYVVSATHLSGADVVFKYGFDNAGAVYVNGVEVAALTGTGSTNYSSDHATTIPRSAFVEGVNVVAIRIENEAGTLGNIPPGSHSGAVYIGLPTSGLSLVGRSKYAARCDHGHWAHEILVAGGGTVQDHIDDESIHGGGGAVTTALTPSGAPTDIVNNARYNGFPYVVRLSRTQLLMISQDSSEHASSDAKTVGRISQDNGNSWGPPFDVLDDPVLRIAHGKPLVARDGSIYLPYATGDGTTVNDNYFGYVVRGTFDGASTITWDTPVAIATILGTGGNHREVPIMMVQDDDDDSLVLVVAGRTAAEASDTERIILVRSYDEAATFGSAVTVAHTAGLFFTEGFITKLANGTWHMLIREDGDGDIWRTTSPDHGLAWTSPAIAFGGKTLPAHAQVQSGGLLYVSRADPNGDTIYRESPNYGVTWTGETVLDSAGIRNLYADIIQLDFHRYGVAYSIENSTTDADIKWEVFTDAAVLDELRDLFERGSGPTLHDHDADYEAAGAVAAHDADADAHASIILPGLLTVDPGTPSYDDSGADVVVTHSSKWGIDASGPYFQAAGVTAGEEAILAMDPATGELTLVPYNP